MNARCNVMSDSDIILLNHSNSAPWDREFFIFNIETGKFRKLKKLQNPQQIVSGTGSIVFSGYNGKLRKLFYAIYFNKENNDWMIYDGFKSFSFKGKEISWKKGSGFLGKIGITAILEIHANNHIEIINYIRPFLRYHLFYSDGWCCELDDIDIVFFIYELFFSDLARKYFYKKINFLSIENC